MRRAAQLPIRPKHKAAKVLGTQYDLMSLMSTKELIVTSRSICLCFMPSVHHCAKASGKSQEVLVVALMQGTCITLTCWRPPQEEDTQAILLSDLHCAVQCYNRHFIRDLTHQSPKRIKKRGGLEHVAHARDTANDELSTGSLLVSHVPGGSEDAGDDKHHRVEAKGRLDAHRVLGCVAGAESSGGDDTADTAESDDEGRSVSALGLARDARVHPADDERDVGVGTHAGEEAGKVAGTDSLGVAEKGAGDDVEDCVGHDEGGAVAELVREVSARDGVDEGSDVRREGEDLGVGDAETHSAEEERHKVGEGVRDEGGAHEHETVGPVGGDEEVAADLAEGKRVVDRVSTVLLNAGVDGLALLVGQELLGFVAVGEVDDEPPSDAGDGDGQDTLDDEDPAPAFQSSSLDVGEAVSHDGGQTRDEDGEGVEHGHAELDFGTDVPAGEEVGGTGEEGGLEETHESTAGGKRRARVDETLANPRGRNEFSKGNGFKKALLSTHWTTPQQKAAPANQLAAPNLRIPMLLGISAMICDEGDVRLGSIHLEANQFKTHVRNEEHERGDRVLIGIKLELLDHACNGSETEVGPVDQADRVECCQARNEAQVDSSSDPADDSHVKAGIDILRSVAGGIDGLAAAEDFFAAFERTELVVRVVGVDILEVGTLVGGHDDCLLGGERRSRSR